MKNIFAFLSAGVMVFFAACGSENETEQESATNPVVRQNIQSAIDTSKKEDELILNTSIFTDYRTGDIIFQTTDGNLALPIQQATGSNFTHCGMVVVGKNGNIFVLEAFDSVMRTPIALWIQRGVDEKYMLLRLKQYDAQMNEAAQQKMRQYAKTIMGLPYDSKYMWKDDSMYCSELVYKLMLSAGVTLCPQHLLKEYNLTTPQVQEALKKVYGDKIPLTEPMVSPADIAASRQLEKIYAN